MKQIAVVIALLLIAPFITGPDTADAKIIGKDVAYYDGAVTMKGYLAYDSRTKGPRPGVLVVHEWWGLNDYARKRARMLAALGYTALAVDMYGDGRQAMHPDDAGKFSSELMKNFDVAKARFLAALDFLKKQPVTDPDRIAAIGYCFGGGVVLNMASMGLDIRGVASFHGSLGAVKPAEPGTIKAKIRVYTGADDKFVPADVVESFRKKMEAAGADFRIVSYPGAVHSFTSPEADALGKKFNLPLAYNAKADKESWKDMKEFLRMIFRR